MKKIILGLAFFSLFSGVVNSKTYSDRTFLMPRDQITNLPMEYTTWHRNLHRKADTLYNGTIQVVPFYQESENETDIGKYFGFNRGGTTGIENAISADGVANPTPAYQSSGTVNLKNSAYLIHTQATGRSTLSGKYSFRPYQETYGARLSYQQDLDGILDGLFFKANMPFVHVQNNMNIHLIGAETKVAVGEVQVGLLDYLAGRVRNTNANNLQEPLKYAKIDGASHSATGIADIDLQLGYTFWHKERTRAALDVAMIIPTGRTPKAEYLFEAIHGNGGHWGVGLGLDASVILWKGEKKSIEIMLVGNYKYLFEGIERRTLDFKRPNTEKTPVSAGYYELAAQAGQQNKPLFPFANVLTRDIRVTPGSIFDGIINIAFTCKRFTFDIGYNLYAKEEERTELRYLWENDKYAVAGVTYDTAEAFNVLVAAGTTRSFAYDGAGENTNASINAEHLDFDSISTPLQLTHKLYGGFGYEYKKCKYPIMGGIGGSYEWTDDNSALEGWAIWGKLAISW
jgi:hypothetical protein